MTVLTRRPFWLVLLLMGVVALPSLSGCAAMRKSYCNYDGAFATGMNDAKKGKDMHGDPAFICHAPDKAVVAQAYREGYLSARNSTPRQTIVVVPGGPVTAVPPQPRQCVRAYGQEACGYNCVKSYGQVACASHPASNCVASYGAIRCGNNCRASYGKIICDD